MASKNNFSKAVMDLMGIQSTEVSNEERKQTEKAETAYNLNKQNETELKNDKEREQQKMAERKAEMELERKKILYNTRNMEANKIVSTQTEAASTVISKSMVVVGEITSTGDIDVFGDVKGSIKTSGDLNMTGKVIGDLTGNNFVLNGCTIQGNVEAKGNVTIGINTVIVGDIIADNIKINGKVKGNLRIHKMSEFLESALLVGDVSSQTISMNQGAKLHGNVNIALDGTQGEKEFDSVLGI